VRSIVAVRAALFPPSSEPGAALIEDPASVFTGGAAPLPLSAPYHRRVRVRPLTAAFWTLGVLSLGTSLVPIVNGGQGYDTAPLWHAVRALLDGGEVYTARGAGDLLYPPSALLMLLPLGAFSLAWAGRLFFVVDLVTILLATAVLLHLFGLRWRGLPGAIALFGVSLAWPVLFTLDAGNVNGPILLGLAVFLLAAARGEWNAAGILLGLTLALKPILAPLLIVVALYRRWKTLLVAVAIPALLSTLVLLAAPQTRGFFGKTLPLLFHGQNQEIQDVSVSLKSVAERISSPDPITTGIQLIVLAVTLVLLWRRWHGDEGEPRRLVELSSVALVGTFLASSFAFPHYGIFLLPFAVSIADPYSAHRDWITWGALFCIASPIGWELDLLPEAANDVLAERFTLALLLLLVSFWIALRRQPDLYTLESGMASEMQGLARSRLEPARPSLPGSVQQRRNVGTSEPPSSLAGNASALPVEDQRP
jgi:arabinofuranan 3-O-arabinosyltransferase